MNKVHYIYNVMKYDITNNCFIQMMICNLLRMNFIYTYICSWFMDGNWKTARSFEDANTLAVPYLPPTQNSMTRNSHLSCQIIVAHSYNSSNGTCKLYNAHIYGDMTDPVHTCLWALMTTAAFNYEMMANFDVNCRNYYFYFIIADILISI